MPGPKRIVVATRQKAKGGETGRGCDLAELFEILGQSFVLDILHLFIAEPRPRRFVEIQRALPIGANTLTLRLRSLVRRGLLQRRSYDEIPPRVEYELTRKATEFQDAFRTFEGWTKVNSLEPETGQSLAK